MASAILALCYPKTYAPLDSRVWRALFDEQRSGFEPADYARFLARVNELAAEVKALDPKGRWSVQLVSTTTPGGDNKERSALMSRQRRERSFLESGNRRLSRPTVVTRTTS